VAAVVPAGVTVPAAAVPAAPVGSAVVVPPGVLVRSGVPVPTGVADPNAAGVPAPGGEPDAVAAGVPGVPSGITVVEAGGRVAVGCARSAAPTVAETRACTVPSTFTGAADSPHAAREMARRTAMLVRKTDTTNLL
jgi:hypothetical protein